MRNNTFDVQLSHYSLTLKNLAYKFTSDPEEIQDLVQETLLRALKYMDQFIQNPKTVSWLFVIMKNIYINSYRHEKQVRQYQQEKTSEYRGNGCTEPFTVNTVDSTCIIGDIYKALAEMPIHYAEMFTQFVNGYKYKELSVLFGIPEGTIKSRIHHIRKNLQKKFSDLR